MKWRACEAPLRLPHRGPPIPSGMELPQQLLREARRTGGDRACADALQQRRAGKKDGLSQHADRGNKGGCSSGSGGRPRTTAAKPAGDRRSSPSLSDQVLALASGKTQQEIAAACKGARSNHVGAAISRHKRAGRIEERDGKLYAT